MVIPYKKFHKELTKRLVEYQESYNLMSIILTIIITTLVGYVFYVASIWKDVSIKLDFIIISLLIFIAIEVILIGIFSWLRGKKKEAIKSIDDLK